MKLLMTSWTSLNADEAEVSTVDFDQVILGLGTPDTWQSSLTGSPSMAEASEGTLTQSGGTIRKGII